MSTGDTKASRYQTQHMGEEFASTVFTQRKMDARVTGGGIMTWNVTVGVGVFQWHGDMYIEFPTLDGASIRLVQDNSGVGGSSDYGEVTGVDEGEVIYIILPYVTTDDVQPAGTWNISGTPVLDFTQNDVYVSSDPLSDPGVTSENLFVLGIHSQDNQLFMRNDLVLNSGTPSGFGQGGIAGGRTVGTAQSDFGYAGAGTYNDIGFDYLPGQRNIDVWVNGVLQTAGVSGGGVDGYRDSSVADEADYYELVGTGTGPFYRGIQFVTGNSPISVPAAGEEIIVKANVGGQGPQGPPGPLGGLQDSYDEGNDVLLTYDGGTDTQTPVSLEEGLAGSDLGAGPGYLLTPLGGVSLSALEVLRTNTHPEVSQRQKVAAILDSTGNLGAAGVFLFNPYGYGTLEQAMDVGAPPGRDGVFFFGMDDSVGASSKDDKVFFRYIDASDLDGVGTTNPRQLQYVRQESSNLEPRMSSGELFGQVAFNKHGEISAGWGKDFIRWYVLEVVMTPPGSVQDTNVMTPIPIDGSVIEITTKFCGGTAILPYASAPEVQEFFHGNPTTAYVGANLYELKLALDDDGADRNLLITYGRYLDGNVVRIILFFSSEGVYTGEET